MAKLAATELADAFANEALRQEGKPYVWDTAGPDSFDCSGLVCFCYERVTGEVLSPEDHDTHRQFSWGTVVDSPFRRGDLLFFDTADGEEVRCGNTASHVGIALGPDRMIHARNPEVGVIESDITDNHWSSRFLAARRLFAAPRSE